MAELERILLPLLLLGWSFALGIAIALKRFQDSSQLSGKPTQDLVKRPAPHPHYPVSESPAKQEALASQQQLEPSSSENPYAAPRTPLVAPPDPITLSISERPPRSGIHLSRPADLALALGLIVWFSMQIILASLFSGEGEISKEVIISSLLLNTFISLLICSFILHRISQKSAGSLRGWLGLALTPTQAKHTLIWLVPIIALAYLCHIGLQLLIQASGLKLPPQTLVRLLSEQADLQLFLFIAFSAVIVAPLSEELVFRGYLYPVLGRFAGRTASLFLSASFFSLIHGNVAALLGLFLLGLMLTWIYERTGSIWAPIAIHAVFNAIGVIFLYLS